MSRSGLANSASSCAPWAEVGERRAFLCGRWALDVGIDWGMFSDILTEVLCMVWRRVGICRTVVAKLSRSRVHMPIGKMGVRRAIVLGQPQSRQQSALRANGWSGRLSMLTIPPSSTCEPILIHTLRLIALRRRPRDQTHRSPAWVNHAYVHPNFRLDMETANTPS